MATTLQRAFVSEQAPGTWFVARSGDGTVWVKCKNGHIGTLGDHTIHTDGRVEPSVQCPGYPERCDFHDDVLLADWDGRFQRGPA